MALFMDLVALSNGLHGSVQMDSVALFSWIGWLRHHGIFRYRPGYDAVKFFGYIVVFEDYFIHSDMYEASVTDYKNASSISSNDTFTSGCIRISQDNLNKLLSIIPVGTTVIL